MKMEAIYLCRPKKRPKTQQQVFAHFPYMRFFSFLKQKLLRGVGGSENEDRETFDLKMGQIDFW